MPERRWIVIRNWDRFQHYKDRQPPWIKNYTELLHDPAYLELPPGTRSLLHGLWLVYASSRARVPLDTRWITRQLNLRCTMQQLESLNHAGFIEFSASTALADRYQDASASRAREEGLRPEEDLRPEEKPSPPAENETGKPDPNEIRARAFQAYRAHGGNLTLEKERNALARGVTTLLTEGVDPKIIVAAASDLGREGSFPGYLKQRATEIAANGGPCLNRGLDKSKLTIEELEECGCGGKAGCKAWAEALKERSTAA